MSERERWIVYPLLFLALGAALRDKIIKTTESQRIKCQGLWVLDSNDETLLLLGPEQFPDVRPSAPNLLHIDEVVADRVTSDLVAGNKVEGVQFLSPQDRVGKLVANQVTAATVVANNFVLSDGKNHLQIPGSLTVPIMRFVAGLAARDPLKKQTADGASGKTTQPPAPPSGERIPKAIDETRPPNADAAPTTNSPGDASGATPGEPSSK